jgi:oxaloacetate decarboxylase gamma subunit
MPAQLQTALLLLVVGMITVFAILSLVVFTGRILIWVVNKYFSPEEKLNFDYKVPYIDEASINKKKLAAIMAAVEVATAGEGKVLKIEKA